MSEFPLDLDLYLYLEDTMQSATSGGGGGGGGVGGGRMLKQLILGKGHQPSAERIRVQKEVFGFQKVSTRS